MNCSNKDSLKNKHGFDDFAKNNDDDVQKIWKMEAILTSSAPFQHTECYLTAKSIPQPCIHISMKRKWASFPMKDFFWGMKKG